MAEISSLSCVDKLKQLLLLEENKYCADCNAEQPSWVSTQNGVFICLKCSGVHRSIGVEYSFVQSTTLDYWNDENIEEFKKKGPTLKANTTILEYHVPVNYSKPHPKSSREIREKYIMAKYKDKLFRESLYPDDPLPPVQDTAVRVDDDEDNNSTDNDNSRHHPINAGEVELVGIMVIELKSCKNLINQDVGFDKSDPYVIFTLGLQSMKSTRINNNLNPVWHDEIIRLSWNGQDVLKVQVLDHDNFTADDPLGDCSVDLLKHLEAFAAASSTSGNSGSSSVSFDIPLQHVKHGSIQFDIEFIKLI